MLNEADVSAILVTFFNSFPLLCVFIVKDPEKGWFPKSSVVRADDPGGLETNREKPKDE